MQLPKESSNMYQYVTTLNFKFNFTPQNAKLAEQYCKNQVILINTRKIKQMDKPKVQYQAYCAIERCTNAVELNTTIKCYFYGFLGEIHYGKYYGDISYNQKINQFQLKRYTFNYSADIDLPYDYVQSLYLQMLYHWLPTGYYDYRKQRTSK